MTANALVREKVDQAIGILREHNVDAWITFVRETHMMRDPALGLIVGPGVEVTWHSAFILTQNDDRVAIVGRFDRDQIAGLGAYRDIVTYDEGIGQPLREALRRLNPASLAVNTSQSDPAADGLTSGMRDALRDLVEGTPYANLVSAEDIVNALRGRKTPTEIARVRDAVADTVAIFGELQAIIRPGLSEIEIAGFLHDRARARGLATAWEAAFCPTVNAGPDSPVGHAAPGDFKTRRGQLLHVDFGVRKAHYVSDMQRTWYLLDEGHTKPPDEAQRAFQAVRRAIAAGADALRPGALGWEVDQAARASLVADGYPEYQHATGHHIGQSVHDGATVLGPRWERYGRSAFGQVEAGNIFTLELGVPVLGFGFIGVEEDVLVTADGVEWLAEPQTELACV